MAKDKKFCPRVGDMVRVKKGLSFSNTDIYNVYDYIGKQFPVTGVGEDSVRLGNINWYWEKDWLEPVPPNHVATKGIDRLVITCDGRKTTARYYRNGQLTGEGTAVCSPEDKPCFGVGAYHAAQRAGIDLMSDVEHQKRKEEENYYNGKVVCVDAKHNELFYTVGKIYQFKNGVICTDKGLPVGIRPVHSFAEWAGLSTAKWIEIKE